MAMSNRVEYDTCPFCGEPVRQLIVSGAFGRVRSRTTNHIRHVHELATRCKYDDGPYKESIAFAAFPGDT